MITLTVSVDAATLLSDYGAGALIRWESSDSVLGTYTEGGTEALVSGTDSYDIIDSAGDQYTWYRTRISDSGGTLFSEYSFPFQPVRSGYLTVAEFLAQVPSDLSTTVIQRLLDAARADIEAIIGPVQPASADNSVGTVTEFYRVHGSMIMLSYRAIAVVEVIENDTTLDATDYELQSGGQVLRRLHETTSVNPAWHWHHRVEVTYVFDDLAARKRVQAALVELDLNHQPGSSQETIGTWSEQHSEGASWNYQLERKAILATLTPSPAAIW